MKEQRLMTMWVLCTVFVAGLTLANSFAGLAEPNRGLIVHVGAHQQDLSPQPGTLVATVDAVDGRLPLIDNLVNVLVLDEALPREEVLRVLVPGGVAIRGKKRIVKPALQGVDEWTHFLHGPDNNAVSKDSVVDMPQGLQWICGPMWTRDHDATPVLSCQVTAGGRLFYVFDDGPVGVIDSRVPTTAHVIARDAYNGVVLWKYKLPDWYPSHQQWGSVPITLNHRLVAVGETVYVTKGIHGPVVALDAATGQEKYTFEGSEETGEIIVVDGALVAGIRKEAPRESDRCPDLRSMPHTRARGIRGLLTGSQIKLFDAVTGNARWQQSANYRASTIASDGAHILYASTTHLVCRDAADGMVIWKREGDFSKVMLQDGVAVCIAMTGKRLSVNAYDIAGGDMLWSETGASLPTFSGCFYIPPEVFITNGQVWIKDGKAGNLLQRDLKTGKVTKSTSMAGGMTEGHHVRCYPAKATEKYLLLNKRGIEFIDRDGKFTKHDWVRGQCRMGIMPANGMVYVPPNGCNCGIESYVRGMQAMHSRQPVVPVEDDKRLTRGPAFKASLNTEHRTLNTDSWPTFRRDSRRTASRDQAIDVSLKPAWEKRFSQSLSTATATADTLYLGEGGYVLALDLARGNEKWRYEAAIDSPPTVAGDMVVFGGRDGYVYNLRASDGKLIWRFLAAPVDRRHVAFGKLESVWPCHGSTLVKDDTVYVAAGRSSFLDGGISMYGLDLVTGEIRCHQLLKTTQPQDTTRADTHNARGALPDIPVTDGEYLYMRQLRFDWNLKLLSPYHPFEGQTPGHIPRVQASSGFLDHSESKRLQRVAARPWTGRYSQLQSQQLSLHENINYGCRVLHDKGWKSPRYHAGDGTYVFAHDLTKQPEKLQTIHANGSHQSIKGGPPNSFFNRQPREDLEWETHLPMRAMATVVAGDKLLVAGRHDRNIDDVVARAKGRDTGGLWVLDKKSGEVLDSVDLPCVPQIDGMLVVGNQIVITGSRHVILFGHRE